MSMNKKIYKSCLFLILFATFFVYTNVYASCSDYPTTSDQSGCEKDNTNGFACKLDCGNLLCHCNISQNCADGFTKDGNNCVANENNNSNNTNNSNNNNNNVACSSLDTEEKCGYYSKCMWNNNSCIEQYIADSPCTDQRILLVLRFFGYLLLLAKVAIPLIIIGFGTFDLLKSVVDKDEKSLTKQTRILLVRVAVGLFIFFIPSIINLLFSLSPKTAFNTKYTTCKDCLLTPTKCSVSNLETTKDDSKS